MHVLQSIKFRSTKAKGLLPCCFSISLPAIIMIVQVLLRLAAAQETNYLVLEDQEEFANFLSQSEPEPNHKSRCLLDLPEIVRSYLNRIDIQRPAICLTQHDVDLAFQEAATRRVTKMPLEHQHWGPQHSSGKILEVISKAELVAEASRILAKKFHLSDSEILYELTRIDAQNSPTLARICPSFLKKVNICSSNGRPTDVNQYRSLSGMCNNALEPSWGSAYTAMARFLKPDYQDKIWAPRVAKDGSSLPSARVVSFVLHQADASDYDNRHSMLGVVWGQFVNHDLNLGARMTEEDERLRHLDCCKQRTSQVASDNATTNYYQHQRAPDLCLPIEIPKNDPFYGYFGQTCMNFVRLAAALKPGCSMGPVQTMNKQSSYLDGSVVYGYDESILKRLRAFHGGLLKSQPPIHIRPAATTSTTRYLTPLAMRHQVSQLESPRFLMVPGHKELLPANLAAPNVGCERHGRQMRRDFCFDAGDHRANEQIQLASLHTVMMREHNRLARDLAVLNPHWSDERLFQEAKRIVAAQIQHITYAEYLPLVLGQDRVREFGLQLSPPGHYFHGYSPKVNPSIRVEFQAAAFRFGHSLVPGHIDRYNKFHQKIESVRLSNVMRQPFHLYHPGVFDSYIMSLVDQPSGRMDVTIATEMANHLFKRPNSQFGLDLAAINIQRAREMGVQGYNAYREFCGLPRAHHFADLIGSFKNTTLIRMAQLYKHVDDIDLFTGGLSENSAPGSLIGPTFGCLVARQAALLRMGDRFWYENPGQFSLVQLNEIRRQTSARLLCDNADDFDEIQTNGMLMPDSYANPRVPCNSLPSINLLKWKEFPQSSSAILVAANRSHEFRVPLVPVKPNHDQLSLFVQALDQYQKQYQKQHQKQLSKTLEALALYADQLIADITKYPLATDKK